MLCLRNMLRRVPVSELEKLREELPLRGVQDGRITNSILDASDGRCNVF